MTLASGGTVLEPLDGYRYHVFTASGTLTIDEDGDLEVLVVGGGGGGGGNRGGGGGAGGVVTDSILGATGSLTVTIGAGGSAGADTGKGGDGGASSIGSVSALGGGGGGGPTTQASGRDGGSGGGEGHGNAGSVAGAGTSGQGNNGGNNNGGNSGGGGGGASAVGGSTSGNDGGIGGAGVTVWSWSVGGGGGGGGYSGAGGAGGFGGGGAGKGQSGGDGANGTANTGGGGGGGTDRSRAGRSGGSGLVVVRYEWEPPAGGEVFASVSFTAEAALVPAGTRGVLASAAFITAGSFAAESTLAISWPSVRFTARGTFVPTIRPRGKKRRTVIVDSKGNPFGELENARHGAITKELNRPDAWTFALGITDPKARLVLEERIREAQLWRGDRLLSWGPMIRPGADKANVAVTGADALWYLGRRSIGRAGRVNYVPNGDFELGLAGWSIGASSPLEPVSGQNPNLWIGQIRTDRQMTGRRSLYLEQKASSAPKYGVSAGTFFGWEVDPAASPDGDRWTLVAYAYVVGSKWRGPNYESAGIQVGRWSTTETISLTTDPDPVTGQQITRVYPAPIEGARAQIDEYTPRDQWVRLEASLTQRVTGEPELVGVTLYAPDGAVYFDRVSLTLEESTKFYAVDQALIVKGLVEHAQDPDFDKTDLNLETDTPLTGVLRDRVYVHSEHPNVLDSILEFAGLDNGLDVSVAVTPTKRILRTHYPARGVYRPKCRLELGRQIADFAWSFDGEAASNAIIVLGQGTGSGREEGFAINPGAFAGDLTLEAVFSAPPETPIDSLDNLATEYAIAASDPQILAVKTFPNLENVIGVLDPGDWIPVRILAGRNPETGLYALEVAADYRVSRLTLNPDDTLDLVLNLREVPT